ncbi:MAG TPA: histidine kinase [Bryobacteraceae bacterium]|jgi:two-component system sensor histidine kinase KdpD
MLSSSPTNGEPGGPPRGKLKIFLGYAAGVGKTFKMLQEAQERRRDGADVVVGYFEPHGRADTIAQLEGLEVVPRRILDYRDTTFEEMDAEAILARHPEVAVVDEFPHTNVPGSPRTKRWEDVLVLMDAGIDVYTTMNVQHLESLNDHIQEITGIRVRETVPDWVMQQATEVVMIDLTPRALLNRLERGAVYKPEKARQAKEHFFKESTLVALRELALRQTAYEVELRHGAAVAAPPPDLDHVPASPPNKANAETILVYLTPDPAAAALIRRAKRVADFFHAECWAVAVCDNLDNLAPADREALEKHLNFARNLHLETRLLEGTDPAQELIKFAHDRGVTQVYMSRPRNGKWSSLKAPSPFARDLVKQVVRLAHDLEITIVSTRQAAPNAS